MANNVNNKKAVDEVAALLRDFGILVTADMRTQMMGFGTLTELQKYKMHLIDEKLANY